jgi:glycosyltransferase involved in cell wall biosynthesis
LLNWHTAPTSGNALGSAPARNRVLIVSSHFPPDRSAGTHRVLRLANYLHTHGWTTSVLTIAPAFYRDSIQLDDALVRRADPTLTIFRTGAYRGVTTLIRWRNALLRRGVRAPSSNGGRHRQVDSRDWKAWRRHATSSLFGFPDDEIGWLGHAVMRGLHIVRRHRVDVVLSSAPPFTCHLIGHALRSTSHVRWVADFRDPWSRAPWGKPGSARAHQWLETQVIKRADAVVLNTPELHREFAQWYGADISKRFHVVANGYDADILEPYANAPPVATSALTLTHAGNLYGARNPLPLLEALGKCLREGSVPSNGIRLNLVGKIASVFEVDQAIVRLGLSGTVTRTPPVPHDESLRILAASQVLLVIQPDTALQVPAKLYEYVGLRRPILALADEGAVARVVRDGDFGLVVSPTNVDSIATALTQLYRSRETLAHASVGNARVAHFDARYQSGIMAEILSTLAPPTATQASPSLDDAIRHRAGPGAARPDATVITKRHTQ